MDKIEDVLLEAIQTGEVLNIKYNGGSQPGLIRQLLPLSINVEDVRAKCFATNRVKTFKLSKMELGVHSNPSYTVGQILPEPKNLQEALGPFILNIEKIGWTLVTSEKEAGVYRKFKSGKLRKTPDVFIQYNEYSYDYSDFDENGNEIDVMKPSSRPWYVSHKTKTASSFKKLSSAILKFYDNAQEEAERLKLIELTL